jgi:hypothetical protein
MPTEATRITPMITASLVSPRKADATAVAASRTSNGERSWLASTDSACTRRERTALGPTAASRRAASSSGRPPGPLPSRPRTSSAADAAASAAVTGDGTTARSWRLGIATAMAASLRQRSFWMLSPSRAIPGRA